LETPGTLVSTKGTFPIFVFTHEPTLKTGIETVLFVAVAVVILFVGVFRLDSIFHHGKRSGEGRPPRKRRVNVLVEDANDSDPESMASAHKY
jgi:hypothetical protein